MAALRGSQGLEGDFHIHNQWVNRMRQWLKWEQPARPVSNGVSYTSIANELYCGGLSDAQLAKRFRLFCECDDGCYGARCKDSAGLLG